MLMDKKGNAPLKYNNNIIKYNNIHRCTIDKTRILIQTQLLTGEKCKFYKYIAGMVYGNYIHSTKVELQLN